MKIPDRLQIANLPTPVQQVSFEGTPFLIKRDDYSGIEFSGNKIRKLEYLLCDAVEKKADYIFTCGGDQSNHARATAAACVRYGFKPVLFLWGKDQSCPGGNLLMNKLFGAELKFLSKNEYDRVDDIMADEKRKFESAGKNVYVVPEGGSSTLGIWGYINFINELKGQIEINKTENIFIAAGTGGTAAGLMVGLALNGLNIKVWAVNVLYPKQVIRNKILKLADECIKEFSLEIKPDPDNLIILDGYSEEGYKNIDPSKIRLIRKFAQSTGIILDPAYTGKAFNAFYDQVIKNKKKATLFIHTGGFFAVFARGKEYLL